MQFEVWISCEPECYSYEPTRMLFATIDAVEAIDRAANARDHLHTVEVRKITPAEIVQRRCEHGYGPGDHHYESGHCHKWPTDAWPNRSVKKVVPSWTRFDIHPAVKHPEGLEAIIRSLREYSILHNVELKDSYVDEDGRLILTWGANA